MERIALFAKAAGALSWPNDIFRGRKNRADFAFRPL